MFRLKLTFIALMTSCCFITVAASQNTSSKSIVDDEVDVRVRKLIRQLGDNRFVAREIAVRQLIKIGLPAKENLEKATLSKNAEIRRRAKKCLKVILDFDKKRRIAGFAADPANRRNYKLASWIRISSLLTPDLDLRDVFVEMQKAEWDLLEAAEKDTKLAAEVFASRYKELQQSRSSQGRIEPVSFGSIASIIFVASDPKIEIPAETDLGLYNLCFRASFQDVMKRKDSPRRRIMQKLLSYWTESPRSGFYSVRLAMQHDIPQGLLTAKRLLKAGSVRDRDKQYLILAFAKLGTKEHVPFLEKMFSDNTVCSVRREKNKIKSEMKVRDVALAAALHLFGIDPKEFGFANIEKNSSLVFRPDSMGFLDEQKRDAAFAKWQALDNENNLPNS